jgi:hypothetical protein
MESKQRSFPTCSNASQCLRENKQIILDRWEERVRRAHPSAARKSQFLLRDSLPAFLDRLAESIEQRAPQAVSMKIVAQAHASQRATLDDYTPEQVQAEYTTLRRVIFELLDEESIQINPREREIVLDFLVEGREAAAGEYLRIAHQRAILSEAQLSLALESAHMGTFDWDVQSGALSWSDTMSRLCGLDPAEFKGRIEQFWPCVIEQDRQQIKAAIRASFEHKQDYRTEFRVAWADQSVHWILAQGRTYFDSHGNPHRMIGTAIDITERKLAEESLQRSHEAIRNEHAWLEMVLNSIPTPVFLLDVAEKSVTFQNEASKNLNVPIPPTVTPEQAKDYIAVDGNGKVVPIEDLPRHKVARGEEVRDYEMTWHTPKGSISLLMNGKFLPAAYDHPPMGLLSFRDISDVKKAAEELRQSEAKFRILYESNLVGVVFGDVGGGIREANDYFLNLIGYTREEIATGQIKWINLTPPAYLYLDEIAIHQMKETGRCVPYEKPFIRKDGSWVWIFIKAVFTDDLKFKHVAIVTDITERKQTRAALEERERQLLLVTESIPQIVWTAEPDGSSHDYNQNWYIYTGLKAGGGEGMKWLDIVHPEDRQRTMDLWLKACSSNDLFTVEHRMRRHDGTYRWFLSRAKPLHDENGKVLKWFGTSTDIESQKQVQQELERERELREQFVNTLSHDLKNPLSAARTAAQLIGRYPDRIDRMASLAGRISDNLARADKMIEDLLDANRIRAGKGLPIERSEANLSEIAENVCSELASIYGDRFEKLFPKTLEGHWSSKNIYRMLENLLINAIKYGYHNTPVSLIIQDLGNRVEIAVHNYGDPISAEEQKSLFNPFTRSRTAELGAKKGWGLGLTLVKGVAEAHGGEVSVESQPGAGTTFRVSLPK